MLSLGNVFDEEGLRDFLERIRRFLGLDSIEGLAFTAEPKIDGLSITLRYERGRLVQGATRGDGYEGENVTANVRTIADIPKAITAQGLSRSVRAAGRDLYEPRRLPAPERGAGRARRAPVRQSAQCRRGLACASSIPSITAKRPLRFFAYGWGEVADAAGRHAMGRLSGRCGPGASRQPAHAGSPTRRGNA